MELDTRAKPAFRTLAILGFHKIGEPSAHGWRTWNYVPEETFVTYLRVLQDGGWQGVDVATFLKGLQDPSVLSDRAALITFNDGYRSVLRVALPWLQRFAMPAAIFVPTAYVGRTNTFDAGIEPEEPICDWAELRELEQAGISVQSHGVTHSRFRDLDLDRIEREVGNSKQILEDSLGKQIELFAFPYGDNGLDPVAAEKCLRKAGYKAAYLYRGGPIMFTSHPIGNPYRFPRIPMGPDTDLAAALAIADSARQDGLAGGR